MFGISDLYFAIYFTYHRRIILYDKANKEQIIDYSCGLANCWPSWCKGVGAQKKILKSPVSSVV